MHVSVEVLGMSEAGVKCSIGEHPQGPFWLPKNGCMWSQPPRVGDVVDVDVPDWMAKKHKQLGGDGAAKSSYAKPAAGELRDMSGALFKNRKKETEKQPDYIGDVTVNGQKFRLSAWLKDSANGKYMSLSVKADKS